MNSEILRHNRNAGLTQTRALVEADGSPSDLSDYEGVFEARFVQQLHGKSGVAFSVDTTIVGNVSSVTIPDETLQENPELTYLWYHKLVPTGAGEPRLLGWGILELTP